MCFSKSLSNLFTHLVSFFSHTTLLSVNFLSYQMDFICLYQSWYHIITIYWRWTLNNSLWYIFVKPLNNKPHKYNTNMRTFHLCINKHSIPQFIVLLSSNYEVYLYLKGSSYCCFLSIGYSIFSAARGIWHGNSSFVIQYPRKCITSFTVLKFSNPCSGTKLWGKLWGSLAGWFPED